MYFNLVDRILELEPARRIVASKNLTLGEEYLAEHFPGFPVMPGVLMIEAITQASAWLVRLTEQFRHSVILLKEAKQVKFGQFVVPGRQLMLTCEWVKEESGVVEVKAKGTVDGKTSVSAKLALACFNLADRHPIRRSEDRRLIAQQLRTFQMLATCELRQRLRNSLIQV